MNQALVVGSQGIIGSALFRRLQTMNLSAQGTTHRQANGFLHLNLLDDPTTWPLADTNYDVAFLCAGVCRMALCEDDPAGTRKTNIDGMSALVEKLAKKGTFIVFLSTNQVLSGNHPHATPDSTRQPQNEYGRQKADMETFIQQNTAHHAIVRLTKVVEPKMALVQQWINQLTSNQTISAFEDMMLAPVSLRQVIDTLILIGQHKKTGIYHVSGKEDLSYADLAKFITAKCKSSPTLVQSATAVQAGIKKNFLPQFTSLDCSSTIALGAEFPPHFSDVLDECFFKEKR